MRRTLRNIVTLARREFLWRVRSRAFAITTAILVIISVAIALAPVLFRYLDVGGPTKIAVVATDWRSSVAPDAALGAILNGAPGENREQAFEVVVATDLAAAKADVESGDLGAVLDIGRSSAGDLSFTLFTKAQPFERTPQLITQAVTALALQDRLAGRGIDPVEQARLFAPPDISIEPAAAKAPGAGGPTSVADTVGGFTIAFALTILIFMAIIGYGNWVAMSVAEEKNSRVMEVILGAATPFQLLAGKVVGAGAAALTQYAAIAIPAGLALAFQSQIASLLLGSSNATELPSGLTVGMLVAFGLLFVLGFGLYAVLYAGAASLVSRQEDVNQIVTPLTLLSTAGYLVAAYAGSGIIEASSPIVTVLSYVPLTSPYLMLSRIGAGLVGPTEVAVSVAILAASIPAALWVAARLYRAGVLMYGQRPGLGTLLRALRTA